MAFLKSAINALDPAPDQKKDITLLLSLLSELCEQKVTDFTNAIENELRTSGSVENKTIPVTEILARHKEYRAYIKSDAGKIANEVTSAISDFMAGGSGNILTGVAKLVTTGLEAIIGAGSGFEQKMESYYIVVQDYGIARYDIRIWGRMIEAQGITTQIENAFAIVAFKSSVDITKISLNTFLISYGSQLAKMKFTEQQQKEYLDYAEEIYHKLRNSAINDPNRVATQVQSTGVGKMRLPGRLYGSLWEE